MKRGKRGIVTRIRGKSGDYERPAGVEEGSVVSVFRVPPEVAGQRLDVFLTSQFRRTSRTRAQHIIRASAYDPSGRMLKPNDRVHAEQEILLWRAPWDEAPVPTDIPVLYEDEHLIAIDKPALLPVHPTARYFNNTVIRIMQAERPGQFLSLGHRLDRETSGVMLVTKNPLCDRNLKKQLEARDGVEKTYEALTWGKPEWPGDRFRYEQSVELDDESPYGVKMRFGKTENALYASTVFEVLGSKTSGGRTYSRVRCDLETGRQHQIRIHLAFGFQTPIVGDKLYGPDDSLFAKFADGELTDDHLELLELPRHALHAARISLPHPVTGVPLAVEAPFPEDLKAFWDRL